MSGAQTATKVNTVADLRALTPVQDGMLVQTLGRNAAGDGGGGTYYWNSASIETTNIWSVFNTTIGGTGRFIWTKTELVVPELFSAVGDGVTDSTTAINTATANQADITLPYGTQFKVSALTNLFGSEFLGVGKIVTDVTYGTNAPALRQLNSYADRDKYVFGREYLSHAHKRLMAGLGIVVTMSGDSTTFGTGATSPYLVNDLIATMAKRAGLKNVTTVNRGLSAKDAQYWSTNRIPGDLATSPNVLVIRWGINDPYYGRTAAQAIESIRYGLSGIRSSNTLAQLSIVLCSPNSTSDSVTGQDAKYYEVFCRGLKQAARDYQCVFVDNYAYLQDSFNAADWMDNPYGNGIHIHPNNVMNLWLMSLLGDVLFPAALVSQLSEAQNINVGGAYATKSATDAISTYEYGISQYRAYDSPLTWPFDGHVITMKSSDGTAVQINYAYQGTSTTAAIRFYKTGSVNAFSDWRVLGDANSSGATASEVKIPTTSVTNYLYGSTIYRAYELTNTWPHDGYVFTTRSIDGSAMQMNWGYQDTTNGAASMRLWKTSGPLANTWTPWVTLGEVNIPASRVIKVPTDDVTTYQQGMSQYRASGSPSTWPLDGIVITDRNIDGPAIQWNYGFVAGTDRRVAVRRFASSAWQQWDYLTTHQPTTQVLYSGASVTLQCANGPGQSNWLLCTNNATLAFFQARDRDEGTLTVIPDSTTRTITLPSSAYSPTGSTISIPAGTTNHTVLYWKVMALGGTNLISVRSDNFYR